MGVSSSTPMMRQGWHRSTASLPARSPLGPQQAAISPGHDNTPQTHQVAQLQLESAHARCRARSSSSVLEGHYTHTACS